MVFWLYCKYIYINHKLIYSRFLKSVCLHKMRILCTCLLVVCCVVDCRGIDLSHRSLLSVPENVPFDSQELVLAHNLIATLSRDQFVRLPYLQRLDISWNRLEVLPEDVFGSNKELKWISLDHNPLVYISQPSLNVNYFSCAHCRLSSLPQLFFVNILNVTGNMITTIKQSDLNTFTNLIEVNLKDNPLPCVCALQKVYYWCKSNSLGLDTTCQEPLNWIPVSWTYLETLTCQAEEIQTVQIPQSNKRSSVFGSALLKLDSYFERLKRLRKPIATSTNETLSKVLETYPYDLPEWLILTYRYTLIFLILLTILLFALAEMGKPDESETSNQVDETNDFHENKELEEVYPMTEQSGGHKDSIGANSMHSNREDHRVISNDEQEQHFDVEDPLKDFKVGTDNQSFIDDENHEITSPGHQKSL